MSAIGLLVAVAVSLLATLLLVRVAAVLYERSVLRIGAPIRLRAALAGGARDQWRIHVPRALLQAIAIAGLLGGVIVGTSRPLGVVLIVSELLAARSSTSTAATTTQARRTDERHSTTHGERALASGVVSFEVEPRSSSRTCPRRCPTSARSSRRTFAKSDRRVASVKACGHGAPAAAGAACGGCCAA